LDTNNFSGTNLKFTDQKWMKTRPRLNALEMYSTGCDSKNGIPNNTCTTAAPNKAKKTPLMLMLFTISRSKEGAKRRTFILTETAPLQKRLIITKCQQLFSSNGISVWQFIKNKKRAYEIYYHTVEIT